MNKERLEQTVRVLKEAQAAKLPLYMERWTQDLTRLDNEDYEQVINMPENPCGTACCAVGWAARDRWHQKEGLTIEDETLSFFDTQRRRTVTSWCAVEAFYDIEHVQALKLFTAEYIRWVYKIEEGEQ